MMDSNEFVCVFCGKLLSLSGFLKKFSHFFREIDFTKKKFNLSRHFVEEPNCHHFLAPLEDSLILQGL